MYNFDNTSGVFFSQTSQNFQFREQFFPALFANFISIMSTPHSNPTLIFCLNTYQVAASSPQTSEM